VGITPEYLRSPAAAAAAATQGWERWDPRLSGGGGGIREKGFVITLGGLFFFCFAGSAGAPSAACLGPRALALGTSLLGLLGMADAMQASRMSWLSAEQQESSEPTAPDSFNFGESV